MSGYGGNDNDCSHDGFDPECGACIGRRREADGRNMYGCTPCPKCGGKYRVPYKSHPKLGTCIACDDCGRRGPWDGTWAEDGFSVNEVKP